MKTHDQQTDYSRRFLFEEVGIRGQRVRLLETLQHVQTRRVYPTALAREIGLSLLAASLLSATVKHAGRLSLQVRGDGAVSLLLAQTLPDGGLRAFARWEDGRLPESPEAPSSALFGNAELVIAIAPERGSQPYQGIVPLLAGDLVKSIEHYFAQSEQIPTRLWLTSDGNEAHGLLLQRLPGDESGAALWEEVIAATNAVAATDLAHLDDPVLLQRLYPEHPVRLFSPEQVRFDCGCSEAHTASMVRALGAEEAKRIVEEEGAIEVVCEFCGAAWHFDAVDVEQILSSGVVSRDQPTQ